MRFRKKPIIIEAMQLPAEHEDAPEELIQFLEKGNNSWTSERDGSLCIYTLEGDMLAMPGDWVIRGIQGELYPCKPDIFLATYEPVSD